MFVVNICIRETIETQFFDSPQVALATPEKGDEIADLKADVAQLTQRLTILEQAVTSGKRFSSGKSRTSHQYGPSPVLPPQTSSELGRRLGVTASTVEESWLKGESYFKDWSKRIDPNNRIWYKRGELFHSLSE